MMTMMTMMMMMMMMMMNHHLNDDLVQGQGHPGDP
jgi:hypothetical protein